MEGSSSNVHTEYVKMPWEDDRSFIIQRECNEPRICSRWEYIQKMLNPSTKIKNVDELIKVIRSYNDNVENRTQWRFPVLKEYIAQLSELERNQFFEDGGVLSSIINLSISLRELVSKCRILKTGYNSSIKLHQKQIASILASAFLCTFPKGKANCPSINFNTLFEGHSNSVLQYCVEKIKCIIHYFKRIRDKQNIGIVTFHRHMLPDHKFPRWDKATATLCSVKVNSDGKIEDQKGHVHMDFSNRYVGGGVLGRGCVQEEIFFVICPELIAARLFTECLADNESLSVVGAERYCTYTGYSNTFCFAGDYVDKTPFDSNGQRKNYLTIIDALYFQQPSEQYKESKILRELKKAYLGFKQKQGISNLPMATGNWGCGAFGGDPQLKSLLQIMASSQGRRDMLYLTFGDAVLKNQIEEVYQVLKRKGVNVGELYRIIRLYNGEKRRNQSLFEFVLEALQKPEKRKSSSKSITSFFPKSTSSSTPKQFVSSNAVFERSNTLDSTRKPSNEGSQRESEKSSEGRRSLGNYTMRNYIELYRRPEVQAENGGSGTKIRELGSENMFDVIWYENECGSSTSASTRGAQELPQEEEKNFEKESEKLLASLFSEDVDMEENSKTPNAVDFEKLVQPKITDFF